MTTAAEVRSRISADPLWFPRVVLGRTYWSKQAEMYRGLHEHPVIAAKGGQSVGKTKGIGDYVAEIAATCPGRKIVLAGPKFEQIERNLWGAVREAFRDADKRGVPLGGKLMGSEWKGPKDEGWIAIAGANREESLRLGHGEKMTVVVDEATSFPDWAWRAVNGMLASEGSQLIVSFNPTDATDQTKVLCDEPGTKVYTLSCLEHPNVVMGENVVPGAVTKKWVDDFRERLEKGTVLPWQWDGLVEGKFPSAHPDALLSTQDLEACEKVEADDMPRLGLDVARSENRDRNVLVYVSPKREARIVEEWHSKDLMQVAERLMRAIRELGVSPSMTFIDAGGPGGGVIDRCRQDGMAVQAVDFGGSPTGRWAHLIGRETLLANRRAELFWTLRCICKSVAVRIPRVFWSDLGMIRVGAKGNEIHIRSKDDMRKEHGRSPDRADALALCFAAPAPSFTCEVW